MYRINCILTFVHKCTAAGVHERPAEEQVRGRLHTRQQRTVHLHAEAEISNQSINPHCGSPCTALLSPLYKNSWHDLNTTHHQYMSITTCFTQTIMSTVLYKNIFFVIIEVSEKMSVLSQPAKRDVGVSKDALLKSYRKRLKVIDWLIDLYNIFLYTLKNIDYNKRLSNKIISKPPTKCPKLLELKLPVHRCWALRLCTNYIFRVGQNKWHKDSIHCSV